MGQLNFTGVFFMAAGIPTSSSSLTQDLLLLEVSEEISDIGFSLTQDLLVLEVSEVSEEIRDIGDITHRSMPLLSTQTSARDTAEAQSFITSILNVILRRMTPIWEYTQRLFSKTTPESSQNIPALSQEEVKRELAGYCSTIKDTDLKIGVRVGAFEDLVARSYYLLQPWTEQGAVAVQTQIQIACNELPPRLQKELYQQLSLSMTEQLIIDSKHDLDAIFRTISKIHYELPSVELARLKSDYNFSRTQKARVGFLLSLIRLQLSHLDPDITVEILKKSVLNLFKTFDESLKSEIYTEVQKVVLQETRSNNESADYIDIEGTLINVQNDSLGKMIVDADPLGPRVLAGIRQWQSCICENSK